MVILNIAAGKIKPLNLPNKYFLVNVDLRYYDCFITPEVIETKYIDWTKDKSQNQDLYLKEDIFNFLNKTTLCFDRITVYRFFEHISESDILYFIYLLSTAVNIGGIIEVIVPNYRTLAKRILDEDIYDSNYESENIITTTELLNEKSDPHLSIWTKDRAEKYFELEKRFEVISFDEEFEFDGRNIYLKFDAKRI
jgi:predicted SAM-dependent methyltransferase